ncbi:ureD urease accessory protein [Sarocladium implicatum]|nr:ureD urease accessory protein [Sarocladium implicatum]
MPSPFPKSSSSPGDGKIVAKLLPAGGTGLEAITYQYPLKLISPSSHSDLKSVLVFLLSYGGGLVGGDAVNLSVEIHPGARLSLVTQGHTKIFKSPSPDVVTSQTMNVRIDTGAALCLLPDPVQPFEDSVYTQTQIFRLAQGASVCVLDWVTQGRTARGEDWDLIKWTGRNEVWLDDGDSGKSGKRRLLVRDNVVLSGPDSTALGRSLRTTMHKLGIFGTLILRGDCFTALGDFFLSEFDASPRIGERDFRTAEAKRKADDSLSEHDRWRAQRNDKERATGLLWSAARVRGCVVVKFGAHSVEVGREWVGSMLAREGSIESQFGPDASMCVR